MASIMLTSAASAVGASLGLNAFGQTLLNAGAAMLGGVIDNALFGPAGSTSRVGPRLAELDVLSASEGQPIPRVYGRQRVGGQVIWATRLEEEIDKKTRESGGFLFIGGTKTTTITYRYYANFAVALCEGEISCVNRVWADGKELDLGDITFRVYRGTNSQMPDALIEAKEGAGNAPAYRGIAYVVFERLPLEPFGNRIPQLNFEVFRPCPGQVEERISGINLIPGATEFGYEPRPVKQVSTGSWGAVPVGPENVHGGSGRSAFEVTLDHMTALLPNLKTVNLVVAWFGDDLRCGHCTVRPKVDSAIKETMPVSWRVAGLDRKDAEVVSMSAGRPAYGGTPNDASVIDAIRALKARGLNVTVLPFMMMDIPEGNGRPDPYRERAEQAAFPWRGRITSDPAPGCENHLVTTHDLSGWSRSSVTVGTVPGEGLPVGAEAAIAVEDASTSAGGFASCAAAALAGRRVTVSVYVKRQATAAAFPALRVMTRLNTHAVTLRYNPATDSINLLSAGAGMTVRGSGMVNAGGDWRRLWVDLHDPDGTMLRVDLFPAIGLVSGFPTANGAATGSALFLAPQLRPGGGYGPGAYVANAGSNPAAADGTAEARVQVGAFLGAAAAADFSLGGNGSRVNYEGPDEWSYRRFILHHAMLAKAGGADSFLIGSEMVALTRLRDETGAFPFVEALKDLAADCRDILGPDCAIGYAADWSEYHSHRPEDGSGDLIFHLDPLWADENVDFIGVDNYLPLTDWRDGDDHLDAAAGARSLYDQDYLQAGIEGGEYFDWFYASEADRRAQLRTPISDGLGKPWVFRNKDIRSWWDNLHYDRSGAVEKSMPTAWVPRSKPVRFIEFGCPAIDKGANQPNLFIDAKSSESGLPHFSTGARDDAMQRAYLAAMIDYWAPASGHNPTGSYGGPMVDADRMCVWAFDARPFPSFPADRGSWGDAANWVQGHWISGRVMAADLPALVTLLAREYGFDEIDVRQLHGVVDGYRIDRTMSLREALEPLERLFGFDVVETATGLRAVSRRTLRPVLTLAEPQLADVGRGAPIARRRRQETELPQAVRFRFEESLDDYRMAAVEATMALGFSARVAEADMAVVTDQARAQAAAECLLQELWAGREEASFSLPPSLMALETGDVISLEDSNGTARRWRVTRAVHRGAIECEAQAFDGEIHAPAYAPHRGAKAIPAGARAGSSGGGRPLLGLLDLPLPQDGQHESGAYAIAYGAPWPGYLQLYRSADGQGFAPEAVIEGPAAIGETLTALQRGVTGRWDHANQFEVRMISGSLASLSDSAVLAGGNLIAIEGAPDRFELLQFARAELIADNTWRLSRLLRGQFGSDAEMADVIAAGARVVVIDGALTPVGVGLNELGRALSFRAVPPGAGLDSERTASASFTFAGLGLRPLSPVHLRGRRLGNGDIALSWIRRTRLGGDSWHLPDVPLGEASEAYAVRILGAEGEVIREMAATGPALVYPAGLQIEDFGALPPQITVEVAQVSAIWGAGAARREVIHV